MASFAQPEDDLVLSTGSTRPFDDNGYLGYDPRLSSQRFNSFVDSKSLKDSATNSPIFHGSAVDNAFATQPVSEAFSPPSIYVESNGQGFDGGFGGSDDPILPPSSEMLPLKGFTLKGWRRQNAIHLEEKEKREMNEFKVGFNQKRKITTENNKAANREREKVRPN
ncbi:hypothetical protein DVH24_024301 [Malus domestica]|uniref:Clathrin light chain n=1 Tax=Malus domestica TaxID=3750 RepID=A0A498JIF1_MALDO|nr:hypothetical protein DVH24_024301 [Malus domestica]